MRLLTDRQGRRRSTWAVPVRLVGSSTTDRAAASDWMTDRRASLMLRHPQIAAKSLPTTSTKLNQSLDGSPVDANCNHRRRATCHVRYSCSLYLYEYYYYYYYYYYCSLESRCIKAHLSTDGCIYRDGYCDVMTWGGLRLTAVPKVNSALHPFGVAKSSTSFGWVRTGMSPLPGVIPYAC